MLLGLVGQGIKDNAPPIKDEKSPLVFCCVETNKNPSITF